MTTVFGYLSFFAALTIGLMTLSDLVVQRKRVRRNLEGLKSIEVTPQALRKRELSAPILSRVIVPSLRKLGQAGRRLTPDGAIERLRKLLEYAGGPATWDAERVLAFKLIGAAGLGGLTLLLSLKGDISLMRVLVLAILMAATGFYVPDWYLRSKAQERQEAMRRALPDSLDLLSITVEAGLGFDAAIQRVSREVGGPLGAELHRVIQEMQLGKSRTDAFRDMADRSEVMELRSFVVSVVQADVFGLSVAKALSVQAKEMRVKRRQRAEERAQKIPVKMVFPLLFCIFPALFVVLVGPAALRISESFLGL